MRPSDIDGSDDHDDKTYLGEEYSPDQQCELLYDNRESFYCAVSTHVIIHCTKNNMIIIQILGDVGIIYLTSTFIMRDYVLLKR